MIWKHFCQCFYFFKRYPNIYHQNSNPIAINPTNSSDRPLIPTHKPSLPPIHWKDTKQFIPPIEGGQVIKVYDGDTITIVAKMPYLNSPLYRFPIRFRGIDSPELHGANEDEKQCAILARDALSEIILHRYVTLKNIGNEKYGRILADVYLDDLHLNEWLLRERLAVPYDGGTKKTPKSWIKYRITGEIVETNTNSTK